MPIWMELLVLLLVVYAAGLALGWAIWRSRPEMEESETDG